MTNQSTSTKQNVIIIGGSHEQECLVRKVMERGYTAHVFDYNEKCVCSTIADHFYPVSIYEPEEVLAVAKNIHPVLVLSIASEQGNRTATYLCEQFGLPTNGAYVVEITTDKHLMKQVLVEHQLPTPSSFLIESPEGIASCSLSYPFIVKAADRTGGRGVQLVHNKKEFEEAFWESKDYSTGGKVLVEEYFQGKQYSIETISHEGKHQVVAMTEEFYTGAPYFVECENMMQARLSNEVKKKIEVLASKTLDAFGLQLGVGHIELRINEKGEMKIIELASRMGGDLRNEQILRSTGEDFVGMLMDVSLGNPPRRESKSSRSFCMIKYICEPQNFNTYQEIKAKYPHFIIREEVEAPTEDFRAENCAQRRGFYLLHFDDESLVEELLRR